MNHSADLASESSRDSVRVAMLNMSLPAAFTFMMNWVMGGILEGVNSAVKPRSCLVIVSMSGKRGAMRLAMAALARSQSLSRRGAEAIASSSMRRIDISIRRVARVNHHQAAQAARLRK